MSAGYEKKDVSVTAIVLGAAFTVALIIFFVIFLDSYFVVNKEKYMYDVLNVKSTELEKIRSAADSMLHNYGIVDSSKGIYQVPIDSAMQMVVDDYSQK